MIIDFQARYHSGLLLDPSSYFRFLNLFDQQAKQFSFGYWVCEWVSTAFFFNTRIITFIQQQQQQPQLSCVGGKIDPTSKEGHKLMCSIVSFNFLRQIFELSLFFSPAVPAVATRNSRQAGRQADRQASQSSQLVLLVRFVLAAACDPCYIGFDLTGSADRP